MSWGLAIIVLLAFMGTRCFGLGKLQCELIKSERPVWLMNVIMTISTYVAFTVVFGLIFSAFNLDANSNHTGLKLIHAPIFALLPAGVIGCIGIIGILFEFLKNRSGERSS